MDQVREVLAEEGKTSDWLLHLDALDHQEIRGGPLSSVEDLPPALLRHTVPHADVQGIVAALRTVQHSAGLWWLLERCVRSLATTVGDLDRPPLFPQLPQGLGPARSYFYVLVFLAASTHTRDYHRRREVDEVISWVTLTELGRNMAVHRRRHGCGGVAAPDWLMFPFGGMSYHLGRLQFQRHRLSAQVAPSLRRAGSADAEGDASLAIHIPATYGPLTPASCDAALARASEFFPRHFPDEPARIATCGSWLLDEQLAERLPADSNILAFRERFELVDPPEDRAPIDDDIVRFVFGRTRWTDPDELTPRTTLEHAIVDHLRAGRHWYGGLGWLVLPPAPAGPSERPHPQPEQIP